MTNEDNTNISVMTDGIQAKFLNLRPYNYDAVVLNTMSLSLVK